MHLTRFFFIGFLIATFYSSANAGSDELRATIDSCTAKHSSNFSSIAKCITNDYRGSRSSAESDFFIFMDEIDEDYRGKKLTLAKAKGTLVRAWQDLDNKEKASAAAYQQRQIQEDQRRNQDEQNRIAEEQKRQFEVMREQNYRACVRRNCVSFVDECTQSRMHCVR